MSFDWLERLSKVLVLLHYIENHHTSITNITIAITGLVRDCDRLAAKCTQQRPESDLSKSVSFAG